MESGAGVAAGGCVLLDVSGGQTDMWQAFVGEWEEVERLTQDQGRGTRAAGGRSRSNCVRCIHAQSATSCRSSLFVRHWPRSWADGRRLRRQ